MLKLCFALHAGAPSSPGSGPGNTTILAAEGSAQGPYFNCETAPEKAALWPFSLTFCSRNTTDADGTVTGFCRYACGPHNCTASSNPLGAIFKPKVINCTPLGELPLC